MQNWIIDMMNRFGYAGVAGLIGFENIFPPIPSEVILTFGGFMTTYSNLDIWGVIAAATIGALLGAIVLYGVGRLLPPERLRRLLAGKIGSILRLYPDDVDKAVGWFDKKGNATVFFCRFIPIVRSLISIPAGCAKMNLLPFLLLTTAGSLIWNTVLVWMGAIAGESWSIIVSYMDAYSAVALIVIGVAGVTVLYCFLKKRLTGNSHSTPSDR